MIYLLSKRSGKQKGFILITTLILIVLLTILAVTGISLNSSQERVSANATDSEISFEKAQGALNQGINNILNGTYTSNNFLQNANGFYLFTASSSPIWQTINWSNTSAVIPSFQGNSSTTASYIIEQLPSVVQPGQNMNTPSSVYRITAYAAGQNGYSSVLLQSTIQIQQ